MMYKSLSKLIPVLAVGTALIGPSAHALQLTFNFGVQSSGGVLYACNAGIKYTDPTTEVCYIPNTTTTCDPLTDDNCVCSNSVGSEQWKSVILRAATSSLSAAPSSSQTSYVPTASGTFTQLATDNTFGTRIDSMSIDLGSERYGAEYFVDFCYHGSQIEWYRNSVHINTRLTAALGATDIASGQYRTLSGLNYTVQTYCDQQGAGTRKWAHDGTTASPASPVYDNYSSNMDNWDLTSSAVTGAVTGSLTNVVTASTLDGGGTNNYGVRFCRVRYTFSESSSTALRAWQRNDAQIRTQTKITQQAP